MTFFCKFNRLCHSEFQEIWPSWRRHSSEYLKNGPEVNEFMKNLFSRRSKDSPTGIGWTFVGIQGLESSFVRYIF